MNCLSLNIRGVWKRGKAAWVKNLKNSNGISFIGLQETMVGNIIGSSLDAFWGGTGYDFTSVDATGNSGGLVCLWDPKVFDKETETKDRNFIHVAGTILAGSIRKKKFK